MRRLTSSNLHLKRFEGVIASLCVETYTICSYDIKMATIAKVKLSLAQSFIITVPAEILHNHWKCLRWVALGPPHFFFDNWAQLAEESFMLCWNVVVLALVRMTNSRLHNNY